MHLMSPFKRLSGDYRNGDNRHSERLNGFTGDACPDFLCVGAQKGGTSWLYHQLNFHPDFWMPSVKEVHYFDALTRVKRPNLPPCKDERDRRFLERITELGAQAHIDLHGYSQLFKPKAELLSGDITPAYSLLHDELIELIVSYFPNLKVIFLARDPVERAWSQLSMNARVGSTRLLDTTDPKEVTRQLLAPGVLLRSYPSKIVSRWRRHVRPDLFRIYFFDDLERDPAGLRRSILNFLGADPNKPSGPISPSHNTQAGREKPPLIDKVRCALAQFFKKELNACASELGGRAKSWPARYGFSLLLFLWDLLDDSIDLFFWCDWIS